MDSVGSVLGVAPQGRGLKGIGLALGRAPLGQNRAETLSI
jgi:hypothetical protein